MKYILDLLESKKFRVALITVIGSITAEAGWDVDWKKLIVPLFAAVSFIISQGIADHGKEAAKIQAKK